MFCTTKFTEAIKQSTPVIMYSVESMCSQGWQAPQAACRNKPRTNWALVVLIILLIAIILWWAFAASNASNTFNFGALGAARGAGGKMPFVSLTASATENPEDQLQ